MCGGKKKLEDRPCNKEETCYLIKSRLIKELQYQGVKTSIKRVF